MVKPEVCPKKYRILKMFAPSADGGYEEERPQTQTADTGFPEATRKPRPTEKISFQKQEIILPLKKIFI